MPKLTGWEVTKILKNEEAYADYRDVPIIMFSAMDDVRDKIEGFELGVEDYITKPFNFSEVLARIRAVLRNRALSGQLVRRERKLTLIESLNQSLIYFTDHLEKPVVALLNAAQSIPTDDPKQVEQFAAQVRSECEQTLAALKGLQEEVAELQNEGEKIKQSELSIRDLDQKFQKHFQNLREQQENFNEVSG
jgi:DNA-binding response OmpR family regulator